MQEEINKYTEEINLFTPASADELETFRIKFLGTKGIIKDLFEQFKTIGPEEKRTFGQVLNRFKQLAEAKYNELKDNLSTQPTTHNPQPDLTLPGDGINIGSRHPLSLVRNEIIDIFKRLGFVVAEGPEIEDDWHNFSALNFPQEHPARDMQDTFFLKKGNGTDDIALRTHTSSVQGTHDGERQAAFQGHYARSCLQE